MNRQAIFNRIAKHLLKQNARSIYEPGFDNEPPICAYREYDPVTKTVRKCAVGCLIPFKNYDPQFEGQNIYTSDIQKAIPAYLRVRSDDIGFLSELQQIHDSTDVEFWRNSLGGFAYRHGLDASVLG